jgi:Arc/MetJ-type ribon-helix-helix transcriptional regulator
VKHTPRSQWNDCSGADSGPSRGSTCRRASRPTEAFNAAIRNFRSTSRAVGFYSNRSDFIRTAIRNQLARHADTSKEAASRLTLELGLRTFARRDLEAVQAAGKRLSIRVLGLAVIADDVTPDLATAAIESITVLGALHAPADVKAALADRLR